MDTGSSRLLDDNFISAAEVDIARRTRDAIALLRAAQDNPELEPDPVVLQRARKLQAFFAQPFFAAEAFTKRPGLYVSRANALRGCREILDGLHDDLRAAAFYFSGSIDDIRKGGVPG